MTHFQFVLPIMATPAWLCQISTLKIAPAVDLDHDNVNSLIPGTLFPPAQSTRSPAVTSLSGPTPSHFPSPEANLGPQLLMRVVLRGSHFEYLETFCGKLTAAQNHPNWKWHRQTHTHIQTVPKVSTALGHNLFPGQGRPAERWFVSAPFRISLHYSWESYGCVDECCTARFRFRFQYWSVGPSAHLANFWWRCKSWLDLLAGRNQVSGKETVYGLRSLGVCLTSRFDWNTCFVNWMNWI